MKTTIQKIKFVRKYERYRENHYEVIYRCGKVRCFTEPDLPKTIVDFVTNATKRKEQYDYTALRENKWEMIYEA